MTDRIAWVAFKLVLSLLAGFIFMTLWEWARGLVFIILGFVVVSLCELWLSIWLEDYSESQATAE